MRVQKIIKEYIDDDFYVDEMDSDIPGRRRNDYEGAYEDEIDPFEDEFGASSAFDVADDDIDELGRSRRHRYRRFRDDADFEPIGPDEAEEIIDDDVQAGLDGMKDEDEEDWWNTKAGKQDYEDELSDIHAEQEKRAAKKNRYERAGQRNKQIAKDKKAKKHGKDCKCPDCCK